uniref:Solute carrier family 15 member 2 n=1 Tax=Amphiprion ocellaris TaxID=80972 RepID=A0AAQ5XJL0_AMPOC
APESDPFFHKCFICFIVVNEFCERFSYYGMKALLTLYFVTYLHWDKDLSTAIYHAFGGLCYFTPILGALIADSWLGKFKTIIYLSIVYVIGHVVKSVGAIPTVGGRDVHIALSMLGLILIAFGTGGIKPCVAAFGGDQFEDEHVRERQKFFSIFYMSINAGSLLSTIITPILRGDVQCFGGDCYALAFGVPAALMVVALVVFIAGSGMYKKNPLQGNILLEVCNCVGFALRNRWYRSKHEPRRSHWLDWAEEKYSKRLIQEIKMVLRVLVLYIPLPMFWALFDQQVQEDKRQLYNLYTMHSCRMPLRKMATGMIFAALAFGAATLVEISVVVRMKGNDDPASFYRKTPKTLLLHTQLVKSCVSFLFCFLVIHLSFMYLLPRGRYSDVTCCLKSGECYRLDLGLLDFGAIYTIILKEESGKIVAHKTEDVKANNVHIAWQIPQYALITAGEVMFSITGLEFSYSQAPANMKSVLQAGWLLTVAFGNVIVLIVAEGAGLEQWKEFLLFASLLLGVCIIFSIMTCFYTYVNPEQLEKFYLENSGKEGDNNENMKKKNNDVPLKKTGKGTRL